jgi:putative transposase
MTALLERLGFLTIMEYTEMLLRKAIKISMDGKGRAIDNIFIEHLWKSVK